LVGFFSYPKRKLKKFVKEGEYKEALEFGKSIEGKYSDDPDFLFIMGSIYYLLDDAQNSISYFDRVLKINENDVEALLLKANVHLFLKENDVALDCCEKILHVEPKNPQAQQILDKLEEG